MTVAAPVFASTQTIGDPGPLAPLVPRTPGSSAWIRGQDGMVAGPPLLRVEFDSIDEAARWWAQFSTRIEYRDLGSEPAIPGSGPVAFGSFCFDPGNTAQRSVLVIPRWVVGHRQGRSWLTRIESPEGLLAPDPELPVSEAPGGGGPAGQRPVGERQPNERSEGEGCEKVRGPGTLSYGDGALSGPAWTGLVGEAVRRIRAGAVDKVVLARDLIAEAAEPIDPRWVISRLSAGYPSCWTFHVDGMVGASPEMLVRREAGLVTSRVLAGTFSRSGDVEADRALAGGLAPDSKDRVEHGYAVRSLAEALAPFCSAMNVPDAPYVLELPNVLHLATDVTAVANRDASALALAGALHPTAAVCGTPTAVARKMIAELERLDRGRYAGPVGWVDTRGDGEWAIALRCARLDGHRAQLFAGCGIVADSDPQAELAESVSKLIPMRDALEGS